MTRVVTNIERGERSLQVTTNSKKIFTIDFVSGNILDSKGKILENNPFAYSKVSNEIEYSEIFRYFLTSFRFDCVSNTRKLGCWEKEKIRNFEKFLPYLKYVELNCTILHDPFFPDGYINFLEENNLRMGNFSRELFEVEMDESLSKKDKDKLKILSRRKTSVLYELIWLIGDLRKDKLFREFVYNCLKNSNYTFENCDMYTLYTIRTDYRTHGIIENTNNLNLKEILEFYKEKDKEKEREKNRGIIERNKIIAQEICKMMCTVCNKTKKI